jgi:hypothetical protein
MRQTIAFVFVALGGVALAAQSPSSQPPNPQTSAAPITVTGCLAAGPNNTFTLVAPDTSATANAPAAPTGTTGSTATTPTGSKVVKTITYTLTPHGKVDLKSNVGHQVQVSGSETSAQASTTTVERSAGASESTPRASGATPSVKTTAQAQIVARQLSVDSVKAIADKCDILK